MCLSPNPTPLSNTKLQVALCSRQAIALAASITSRCIGLRSHSFSFITDRVILAEKPKNCGTGIQSSLCEQHWGLEPLRNPKGRSRLWRQPGPGGLSQRLSRQQGEEEAAEEAEGHVGHSGCGAGWQPCCGDMLPLGGRRLHLLHLDVPIT